MEEHPDPADVHDGVKIDYELEDGAGRGRSTVIDAANREYTGSMTIEVENESDFTLGYLYGAAEEECQKSDSDPVEQPTTNSPIRSESGEKSVDKRQHRLAEAIDEPLQNAYQHGVLDGLFLFTLLYTMYWRNGEYQESDTQ